MHTKGFSPKKQIMRIMSGDVKCSLLTCVHAHVLLQRVVIVASFFADPAHEVRHLGVSCHVGAKRGLPAKVFTTEFAGEGPFSGVRDEVRLEVRFVGKELVAKTALIKSLPAGGLSDPGHLHLRPVGVGRALADGVRGCLAHDIGDGVRILRGFVIGRLIIT